MKIIPAMLAATFAVATLGLPTMAFAQNMPGPDAHPPMPNDQAHHGDMRPGDSAPGDMHQGDTRGDMHQGDARTGDMHRGDMNVGEMRGGDMHRADMRGGDMHYGNGMRHHGWHRHCWMQRRHHHRVRVCH